MDKINTNNNFAILALVAIVAVIGVVSLMLSGINYSDESISSQKSISGQSFHRSISSSSLMLDSDPDYPTREAFCADVTSSDSSYESCMHPVN